jgi:hypothetical protein
MATQIAIDAEIGGQRPETPQEAVRKKYFKRLAKYTNRATVLYASAFSMDKSGSSSLGLTRQDLGLFKAALTGLKAEALDLIVHSPGGSIEVTERIVRMLRQRFNHIRVIVPQYALSAATALACAADVLVMDEDAALSPIDPDVSWLQHYVQHTESAQNLLGELAIVQGQLEKAGGESSLWKERLSQFPPGLLMRCKNSLNLSRQLVQTWLEAYLLKSAPDGAGQNAAAISGQLVGGKSYLSSSRLIDVQTARDLGLPVQLLTEDPKLNDLVLSVTYATLALFRTGDCLKIGENQLGNGYALHAPAAGYTAASRF